MLSEFGLEFSPVLSEERDGLGLMAHYPDVLPKGPLLSPAGGLSIVCN